MSEIQGGRLEARARYGERSRAADRPEPCAHVCADDSTAAVSLVLPRTWLCAKVPHTLPLFLFLTIKWKAMHSDLHLADKETEAKIR